ncbi:hypothetical protein Tco_0809804 [Tanacetum coccineum]
MFIGENLSSEDPIYDEAGTSYDSNTLFEVQDHDTFVDHMDEYHEVHEMQSDVQHNYVVDSDADYTSDSNIIPYDQNCEPYNANDVTDLLEQNERLRAEIEKESVETVREIVEEARVVKPLDNALNYAANTPKLSQELSKYVVQIILWYLDSGCSKLNLEEWMAPVHNSSGPEPKMMFRQNSSSLVLHQMMYAQISSGLAPQCLKMFELSSSSLGLHCQKTFKQISSNRFSNVTKASIGISSGPVP